MPVRTMTSREFNQDVTKAKRLAAEGPVLITRRGRPTHVLVTIESWQEAIGARPSLADRLGQPEGVADIEISYGRARDLPRPIDLE